MNDDTLFNRVNYNLGLLMDLIELGQIGLPHIQLPFVWPNQKVRDPRLKLHGASGAAA